MAPRIVRKLNAGKKLMPVIAAALTGLTMVALVGVSRSISAKFKPQAPIEVASVKPTNSQTGYVRTEPGRLTARGRTLASLLLTAYNLKDHQLVHGPAVSLAERCDIDARAEGPAGPEQLYRMLRDSLWRKDSN